MKLSRKLLLSLLTAIVLSGQACGVRQSLQNQPGGVFRSDDGGLTWQAAVHVGIDEAGNELTIQGLNISDLVFSPFDSKELYALVPTVGLYQTDNQGERWQLVYSGPVTKLLLHPKERAVVYLAGGNKVWRTIDSGLSWQEIYIEATPESQIVDLVMDPADPRIIYLATNRGLVTLQSDDQGESWRQLNIFSHPMARLLIHPLRPELLYAVQPNGVIWRSSDGGLSWDEITRNLQEQSRGAVRPFRAMVLLPTENERFIYANQRGIYRSDDGGQNWLQVELLTAPGTVNITTLTFNPRRVQDIYYTAGGVLFKSADDGVSWSTLPLPSSLTPTKLMVDPQSPELIYLSLRR